MSGTRVLATCIVATIYYLLKCFIIGKLVEDSRNVDRFVRCEFMTEI